VRYIVLAKINYLLGRLAETSWVIRRQEYPRVVKFRVRTIRIPAVIYIETRGRPEQGKSLIWCGLIIVPETHPSKIAFSLILYKEAFKTPVSSITLKRGSPRSS
jgi:hypothetical protein